MISPNFELKYGLNKDEIEERLKKLLNTVNLIKKKQHCLFGQKEYLVAIVTKKFYLLKAYKKV